MSAETTYNSILGEDFSFFLQKNETTFLLDLKVITDNSLLLTINSFSFDDERNVQYIKLDDDFSYNAEFLQELKEKDICIVDGEGILNSLAALYKIFINLETDNELVKGLFLVAELELINLDSDEINPSESVLFTYMLNSFSLEYTGDYYVVNHPHSSGINNAHINDVISRKFNHITRQILNHPAICALEFKPSFNEDWTSMSLPINFDDSSENLLKLSIHHEMRFLSYNRSTGYFHITDVSYPKLSDNSISNNDNEFFSFHVLEDGIKHKLNCFANTFPNKELYYLINQPQLGLDAFAKVFKIDRNSYSLLSNRVIDLMDFSIYDDFFLQAFKNNFEENTSLSISEDIRTIKTFFNHNGNKYSIHMELKELTSPDEIYYELQHLQIIGD